jgi:putative NIF3 family GTP cyclohydrolase 1 type 2
MLGRRAELLLKNSLPLLAYHLPLDAHREVGNNFRAAEELGWQNCQPFGPKDLEIGVMGFFDEIDVKEFCIKLEKYYGHPAAAVFGGKERVKSAALISGGAYRQIAEASAKGIDCFITGNFDEPAWHMAREEKLNFFALGHHATERIGPKALAHHLNEQFSLETEFLDCANPF